MLYLQVKGVATNGGSLQFDKATPVDLNGKTEKVVVE